MPSCCLLACGARKTKDQPKLSLHKIPRSEIGKKWVEIIGLKNINPRLKDLYICSLHFEESCFNRTLNVIRLQDGAVPSASLLPTKKIVGPKISRKKKKLNLQDWLLSTCRVCLGSDREMYSLAKTPLEETYERVTSGTLAVEGRPCCVCGVCLSALRRCRRFIDTAREANDALDRWIRNHPNTDTLKLPEQPLFSITRTPTEVWDTWESGVKQESRTTENEDYKVNYIKNEAIFNDEDKIIILVDESKNEVTNDDGNDNTNLSDLDSDVTYMSDDIEGNSPVNFEYVDVLTPKVDFSEVLGNETAGTSSIHHVMPSQEDVMETSRKRVNNEDANVDTLTEGPALKKHKPITTEPRSGNTDPAPAKNNVEYTFSCSKCHYKTTFKRRMYLHLQTHIGYKQFTCDKCDYKSIFKRYLDRHMLTHTDEKPFACDMCDFTGRERVDLKRHIINIHGSSSYNKNAIYSINPFVCDKCDYKCDMKAMLKRHSLTHKKKYREDANVDTLTEGPALKKHRPITSEPRSGNTDPAPAKNNIEYTFSCSKCHYKTTFKHRMYLHVQTHIGYKQFTCDKCDYKSIFKRYLDRHMLIHTDEKPFACDMCDFTCREKAYLKRHIINIHGSSSYNENAMYSINPFVCDKCDYKCDLKAMLKRHSLTHKKKYREDANVDTLTEGPALKKHRPITSEPRSGNTDPAPAKNNIEYTFSCSKCHYKTTFKHRMYLHVQTHIGYKQFTCDKCDYKSIFKRYLDRHMLIHTDEKPFAYDMCDFTCREKAYLKRHIINIHGSSSYNENAMYSINPFVCDKCDYKCDLKAMLKLHSLTHKKKYRANVYNGLIIYMCLRCDFKSKKKDIFKEHLKIHPYKPIFSCSQCNYKSLKRKYLTGHIRRHTDDKPYLCDKCHYKTSNSANLKRHSLTHTKEKPFACDKCDFKTGRKMTLQWHMMSHTGEKPFLSDKCDYRCISISQLKNHLNTHSVEKRFACDKCDFRCRTKNYFDNHKMTHTGEKPFACDKCDFRCSKKAIIRQHLIIHSGQKVFSCDMCDYVCNNEYRLKRHIINHCDKKPFTCDKCDFIGPNLSNHLKKHTGETPFACHMCDYKSWHSGNVKRHLMRHTGERPFTCDFCHYKCAQKASLKQHLLTHTGEKPYLCDKCDYNCTEKRSLYKHIQKVHDGSTCVEVPKVKVAISKKSKPLQLF